MSKLGRNPLVSVLTPTYNHQPYIEDCIKSVLSQSYPHWELIILDDGSDDNTGEIAARYAAQDERVCYLHQPNRGLEHLAATYNSMLEGAQGQFIAILEGDDRWPKNKLSRMIPPLLGKANVVLAYGYAEVIESRRYRLTRQKRWRIPGTDFSRQEPHRLNNTPIGALTLSLLSGNVFMPVSSLIKRSALEQIGGFHTVSDGHAVDYATFLQLSLVGEFRFIPEVTGYWRRHDAQANASIRLEQIFLADYHYALSFFLEYKDEFGWTESDKREIVRAWKRSWAGIGIRMGRHHLANRNWSSARKSFIRAIMRLPELWRVRLAFGGLIMAILHISPGTKS